MAAKAAIGLNPLGPYDAIWRHTYFSVTLRKRAKISQN